MNLSKVFSYTLKINLSKVSSFFSKTKLLKTVMENTFIPLSFLSEKILYSFFRDFNLNVVKVILFFLGLTLHILYYLTKMFFWTPDPEDSDDEKRVHRSEIDGSESKTDDPETERTNLESISSDIEKQLDNDNFDEFISGFRN